MPQRRTLLRAAAALPLLHAAGAVPERPLRDIAAARNIIFGTQVTEPDLRDHAYAALVARECAIITPGIEAKWGVIEPAEGAFRFGPMDRIAAFARAAGLRLHMHNLVWGVGIPAWTLQALRQGSGRAILAAHTRAVATRYADLTESWDAVNEPVDPRWPSGPEGLCTTPWRLALGPGFVADACAALHACVPGARLLINDDDLEYAAPDRDRKRGLYLRLIESWLRAGVPLGGFGLEAHLKPWLPFADAAYRRFLSDLASFGLRIYITELDVCDKFLPAPAAVRDAQAASCLRHYLDLALDEPAVRGVMTWGLSDRTSWMRRDPAGQRADGLPPRPLPYDTALTAKPMRAALAGALLGARMRAG